MLLEKRILTAAMLECFAAHMTEEQRNEQAPPQPRRGEGYGACEDVD